MSMSKDALRPLLDATLVLMAHPDDEIIVCGALMQKMKKATVLFATDGAPRDEYFWRAYGSRQAYADVRRDEAHRALALAGAQPLFLPDRVSGGIADQELFLNLPAAISEAKQVVEELRPDAILTLAYEGGHPDHDAACFISSVLGKLTGIPVWESPLYHRTADGGPAVQTFPARTGAEVEIHVGEAALANKTRMFEIYRSQHLTLEHFHPQRESFRPLFNYDFTVPPLPYKLNYEWWQWKMTGREVSAAFAAYLESTARSAAL